LPTVDELATVVQATTDRLTALAPTSTPTPTATSTPEDTPTSTPTPTDTPTVTPTPTPWTESLFDDFEDGLADFWVVEQGTPEFVNGRLTTPRNLVVTAGDGGWSNYTIEMGTSGFAGRSSEEPLNYIAVAVNEDYKVAFELTGGNVWGHMWIFEDGDWRRVGDRYGGLYSLGGKHLKITVDDGELKALLNGSEIGSYFTTVKTGKVEIKLIADSGIEWIEIIPN
jgi:hypothetical protein